MTTVGSTLETAQRALASQPFSRLIGARLTSYTESDVEITIDVTERLHQQHGSIHGGVIAYAADNAPAFAATTRRSRPPSDWTGRRGEELLAQVQVAAQPNAGLAREEGIRDFRRALSESPGASCQPGRSEPTGHRVVAWGNGFTTTKAPLGG
ncbi:hypothetical protein ABZ214_02965 [Streptomyces iakyrus]|uniref:PaaI family thioesterase n=1 Tax=Streptomyces iakyrus TaxID=68219 RepID=UPI0033A6F352